MNRWRNGEHLLRVALVYGLGVVAFVLLRMALVPRSFGEFGHYRGNAIAETARQRPVFAGHQACNLCHSDVAALKRTGIHAGVHCEACHGPQAAHASDPGSVRPARLATARLCVRCHAANPARPAAFPQIDPRRHNPGLPCETCHPPHNPLQFLSQHS